MNALRVLASLLILGVGLAEGAPTDPRAYIAAGTSGLDPFDAVVKGGRIARLEHSKTHDVARTRDQLLEAFGEGQALQAVGLDGRPVAVNVRSLDPAAQYYEAAIRLDPESDAFLLATTGGGVPTVLPSPSVVLTADEIARLAKMAHRLWADEVAHLEATERPLPRLRLGSSRAVSVPGSADIVAVNVPASFVRHGSADERGEFFFLLDRASGRVTLARFGHPEWSPNAPASVVLIEPIFFFQLAHDGPVYLLAKYSAGWESAGLGILDPIEGHVIGVTEQIAGEPE